MDKVLDVLISAGGPSTVIGGILLLFFYFRKQESGIRTEINASLARLQADKEGLQGNINELEAEAERREGRIDELRSQLRATEDDCYAQKRRADVAEAKLKTLGYNG